MIDEKPEPEFIVYDADSEHQCMTQGAYPIEMSPGSVVQCSCGQYWFRSGVGMFDLLSDSRADTWLPVRWWNRRALRRIREYAAEASK